MKKILASALLAGLLLGTASPVFAAETNYTVEDNQLSNTENNTKTDTESYIPVNFTVSIPSSLDITRSNVDNTFGSTQGVVTLVNALSAAGTISVKADADDLTLTGDDLEIPGEIGANETLTAILGSSETLVSGTDTSTKTLVFTSDEDTNATKDFYVGTTETSNDNRPGVYSGAINFTITYDAASSN